MIKEALGQMMNNQLGIGVMLACLAFFAGVVTYSLRKETPYERLAQLPLEGESNHE